MPAHAIACADIDARADLAPALGPPRRAVAPRLGRATPIVVPAGAGAWLRRSGFRDVRELAVGEAIEVGGVARRRRAGRPLRVTGRRSARRRRRWLRHPRHDVASTSPATRTCSTAWAMLPGEPIDVALLPVWGWGPTLGRGLHLDPQRAAQALRLIRPRAAVPDPLGHVLAACDGGRVYPGAPGRAAGGLRRVRHRAGAGRALSADRGRRRWSMRPEGSEVTDARRGQAADRAAASGLRRLSTGPDRLRDRSGSSSR